MRRAPSLVISSSRERPPTSFVHHRVAPDDLQHGSPPRCAACARAAVDQAGGYVGGVTGSTIHNIRSYLVRGPVALVEGSVRLFLRIAPRVAATAEDRARAALLTERSITGMCEADGPAAPFRSRPGGRGPPRRLLVAGLRARVD